MRALVSLLLLAAPVLGGCSCYSTSANEVGVLTRKVALTGEKGVQQQTYAPGGSYFFAPYINDWSTFETKLQNLRMTGVVDSDSGDDLEFKTVDGNDISVDITVAWRIDPSKAPHLLSKV